MALLLGGVVALGVGQIQGRSAAAIHADLGPASSIGQPLLGEQRWYKMLTYKVSDRLDLLVNAANGNLVVHQKDLKIKGTGLDLKLEQHYNSLSTAKGSIGNHWVLDSGADVRLQFPTDGSVVLVGPSGYSVTFVPLSGGGFADPPGLDATLFKNQDGSFTLGFHQSGERYGFSADGRFVADIDRNSNAISYRYDTGGRLASIVDTQGRTVSATATAAGLVGTLTDPASRTYGFTYDGSGNLVRYVDPSGGAGSFAYSATSDLTQLTDPAGHRVQLAYDASHRVTSIRFVSDLGAGTGPTTTFAYSGATTSVTDPNGNRTTYTSDSGGRVTQVVDAQGSTATTSYTADNNPAVSTDGLGNKTTFSYDALNNLVGAVLGNGAKAGAAYANSNLPYSPTSVTDTQGNATQYAYDGVGNLTQVTDALQHLTKYAYNANGTQASTTDGNGNVTTYQYDAAGNLTGIFPNGLDYTYDVVSRVVTTVDAKSQKTSNTYDALDRNVKTGYADGTSASQAFDADGNRTGLVDGTGTTSFVYDTLGRMASKTLPSGEVISFTYDAAGNLIGRRDNGGAVTYTYNSVGLLATARDPSGASTSFQYDAARQPTRTGYPNGVSLLYAHDGANNVTAITASNASGATLLQRQYSYVLPGTSTPTAQRYTVTDQAGAVTSYGYDALNRLTSAVVKSKAGSVTDSRAYAFDAIGNRTSSTVNGTVIRYGYDATNGTITAMGPVMTGNVVYTYDALGNLVKRSNGYTWGYNAANFTTSTHYQSGSCTEGICPQEIIPGPAFIATFTMAYSGLDQTQRVSVTDDGGQVTGFAYDPTGLNRRSQGTGSTYELRDPNRHLLSERTPSGTYYVIPDALDSTIGLTDTGGALVSTWTYEPWGGVIGTTGNTSTPFQFQGGYSDFGGIVKMSDRYYDPGLGRYTQVDNQQGSLFNPQTLNRYLFQLDNPVNNPAIEQEQSGTS